MNMKEQNVAVVTGASQGIGRSVAEQLAARDFHVVSLDLKTADFDEPTIVAWECDVADESKVQEAAERVRTEFGHVNLLVNNAGWMVNEPFIGQASETASRQVAVNFLSVLYTCRHFLGLMGPGGSIVNLGSDAARLGVPNEAVYAGAKGAVMAFSKSLAVEVGRLGIRVNVVSPGTTLTPLVAEALSEDQVARRVRAVPLGRLGEADDVATVIRTVACDWEYVTGQVVSVNGGSSRPG